MQREPREMERITDDVCGSTALRCLSKLLRFLFVNLEQEWIPAVLFNTKARPSSSAALLT